MATYVYRRAKSTGARQLAELLGGIRYQALNTPMAAKVRQGDTVVCWGEALPEILNIKVLNGTPIQSKFKDAIDLKEAGIPTIEVSQTRPGTAQVQAVVDPAHEVWGKVTEMAGDLADLSGEPIRRDEAFQAGLTQFITELDRLRAAVRKPIPPQAPPVEWLPRLNNHIGGTDLLNPPTNPGFWVKRESIVQEIRVHSFMGKSIRAGVKAPREGFNQPHQWIRSYDGGWTIKYDGVTSKQAHRDLAHKAVAALGLQFGAVDLAQLKDGRLIVLEVNRAPGIEGGTVERYAEAIKGWMGAA